MSESGLKVLVADDDPAMLRLVSRCLAQRGYDVECVGDGWQAQAAVEAECPDMIITDWEMPGLNGPEFIRWLRVQQLPHYIYTLILTVREAPDDIVAGLNAGADDYLPKPVRCAELLARLQAGARVLSLERRLNHLARRDALTGLVTQRTFIDDLNKEFSRSRRYALPVSCVMLDIDFFKRVNDTHGHATGDEVIRQVGRLLSESSRRSDVVSRYGGEEFCVLLPETCEANAMLWAERTRQKIADLSISARDKQLRVTCSFGVAEAMVDTQTSEELVDLADQALLVAKQSGRDRVVDFRSLLSGTVADGNQAAVSSVLRGYCAREVMTNVVACFEESQTVDWAARNFLRFRNGSAPVVDGQGKLVGILSEKDLLSILLWPDWWQVRIRDVMKQNVVCYDEEAPAQSVYDFLCRVAIRSVIVTRDGQPVGVISRGSMLRWFTNARWEAWVGADPPELRREQDDRLHSAVGRVVATANRLREQVDRGENELSGLLSSASQLQDLISDLLAAARTGRGPSGAPNDQVVQGLFAMFDWPQAGPLGGAVSRPSE